MHFTVRKKKKKKKFAACFRHDRKGPLISSVSVHDWMCTLGALNDSTRSSRCTYLFAGVWYDGDPLWSFRALLTFLLPQLKQLKLMFARAAVQHAGLWLAPWRDRDNIKCTPRLFRDHHRGQHRCEPCSNSPNPPTINHPPYEQRRRWGPAATFSHTVTTSSLLRDLRPSGTTELSECQDLLMCRMCCRLMGRGLTVTRPDFHYY